MGRSFVILAGLAAGAITVACGSDVQPPGVHCGDITVPGVIANLPGIELDIRTPQGVAAASGTVVSVRKPDSTMVAGFVEDSLSLLVYVDGGTYSARVSKPFYLDTILSNIVVLPGKCTPAQTTKVPLVLTLAAGAPPVRGVAVFGPVFLATPGSQTRMAAIVDADANISRAVTWKLIDTAMARIDQTGLVTSKCSTRGGTDTVTATSVADPTVSGRSTFGVGAQASCP